MLSQKIFQFSHLSQDDFLKELHLDKKGLFQDEITKRQEQFGLNKLDIHTLHWWDIFFRQFASSFVYLLLGASIVSILLQKTTDGVLIFVFVLLNACIGFYQEYHSEKTIHLLRKFITTKSKVIRCGLEKEVYSQEIVPGDMVVLEAGDLVPADIRLIEDQHLIVDESTLTGESLAITKSSNAITKEIKGIYEANNLVFSGTHVTGGKAIGVVIATGRQTQMGSISTLTTETRKITSYEKGIQKFSKFILILVLGTLLGLLLLNIFIKGSSVDIPNLLIFSVALAVSAIPEALGVVLTFALSHGAIRLSKNKVVIKRLSAIEDLGNIEVLCTDKTGTLTENVLAVDSIYPSENHDVELLALLSTTLEKKKSHSIHSFDTALIANVSEKVKKIFDSYVRLEENPFDPKKKRNSMVVEKDKKHTFIVRGAVEEILKICKPLSVNKKKEIETWIATQGANRILAVATKELKNYKPHESYKEESDLTFVGLISFRDPIKKTARQAVLRAEELGIDIKILTGDSKEVAGHVAREVGIVKNEDDVITGDELSAMTPAHLKEAVHKYHVFARVSPEQKYLIIQTLQKDKEVGFLGEGINDSPALKIANVGMVVDGATDIARETADIILLNKSLLVIIEGIIEGRRTFVNCFKYIKSTLSSNFGNFYTVAITSLFLPFLPLLPVQILLLNLFTDFPMIAVATDTVDREELKKPKHYDMHEVAFLGSILGIVSATFDFIYVAVFFQYAQSYFQTYWFLGSVLTELLFLFSIRTRLPIWRAIQSSRTIYILTLFTIFITFTLPFTKIGQSFFSFSKPHMFELGIVVGIAMVYFIVTEIIKNMYYKYSMHKI